TGDVVGIVWQPLFCEKQIFLNKGLDTFYRIPLPIVAVVLPGNFRRVDRYCTKGHDEVAVGPCTDKPSVSDHFILIYFIVRCIAALPIDIRIARTGNEQIGGADASV